MKNVVKIAWVHEVGAWAYIARDVDAEYRVLMLSAKCWH